MGSFKGDGRKLGRGRRRGAEAVRKSLPAVESLEGRTMLAGPGDDPPRFQPTSGDFGDVKQGPLAKGGQHLVELYQEFIAFRRNNPNGPFVSSKENIIDLRGPQGDLVPVDIRGFGDFNAFQIALRDIGMDIQFVDATHRIVEGLLPIGALPTVTGLAQTVGLTPVFRPITHQRGIAENEGDRVLFSDVARTQFGVDGTGITIGVLSDSVNRFQGGLADSIATGDLPANVNVLLDEPAGGSNSDEGRAMLEQIFDIAPGAALAFNSAFVGGPVGFAAGVRALARQAGAQVIVDDVGYANEPAFQDGLVAQAVTDVATNNNVSYFSSAGNSDTEGYESAFRPVDTTVGNIGAGRFMDFDPGAGTQPQFTVTVNANSSFVFWYDNPFFTTNGVTSDLDIFFLDNAGAIVASGVTNNIATQVPQEFFGVAPGTYNVAIRVNAGSPDVSRIRFQRFGGDATFPQPFGAAGDTIYPTTFGHPAAVEAIGTGAVPWYGAPPFNPANPIRSEVFSSNGPVNILFDPAGNRIARQTRLKPDLSAPDGVDTSFFIPGLDIDTTAPPFPPATPTNLDPDTNPNFFGTSSAAPNLAAVGALLKQLNPGASFGEIRNALVASAVPLNGSAAGAYDPQGGFGLVNAVDALTALDRLRIIATSPANGASVAATPNVITVTFSKPIDFSTVQATDLIVTGPPGVTVVVGTPVLVNPTTVNFPITISAPPGVSSNGNFTFTLADGSILAADGNPLVGTTVTFALADQTAPRVIDTIIDQRIIVIQFSEAVRADQINASNILLVRTGASRIFGGAGASTNVLVSGDPRVRFFYDAALNRAIIDLTSLPQSELPSDIYALVVLDTITDVVGNRLDGEFGVTFPSGNGAPGGAFIQALGFRQVVAPQIVVFGLDPAFDTGISADQNTRLTRPRFAGTVRNPFPGTVGGLTVAIQFVQDRPFFDLAPGAGGRGFVGNPDLIVQTDNSGNFSFQPPFDLRDGFHRVRIVVVGGADSPPLPGFSTFFDQSFRVDTTTPLVLGATIPRDARVNTLRNLSLTVADPVSPVDPADLLAVPPQLNFPALNPSTATNISNYSLINLGPDRALGTSDDRDLSSFISGATFVSTNNRVNAGDPYTGRVDLTFNEGLPPGRYTFVARTAGSGFAGIEDSAGNPLDAEPGIPGAQSFGLTFDLSPEPAFVTQFFAVTPTVGGGLALSGPRGFYETPAAGFTPRAEAPPIGFAIDFSAPLTPRDFSTALRLIRSADSPTAPSDGDFGVGGAGGFTTVTNVTVELANQIPGATLGQFGFGNRLILRVADGTTLQPDQYRIVLANEGADALFDLFGNQVDGEFLGNVRPDGAGFEVLLPDGTFRNGLSGDTIAGGGFVTGFVVTPPQRLGSDGRVRGNVIFARPDYIDDPFLISDDPDGSRARPFSSLAPEAIATAANGGDLNNQVNFLTGFNPNFDRNGNGEFDRSAFFEAQLNASAGPVVIVGLPGVLRNVPGSTQTVQESFVLQAPRGTDPIINDGSASVPAQTMLVFSPGSTLKLQNASLFVQNQGTALQVQGGPTLNDRVNFTSFNDDTVGGDTDRDGTDSPALGGDWGGIVLRNFDQRNRGTTFPIDGRLRTLGGNDARSGADDTLSVINFARVRFAGGAVPQGGAGIDPRLVFRYDAITTFNSRPHLTNTIISDTGGQGSSQAAISGNLDSFREDGIARGPLIRRISLFNNSINGIFVRAESGVGFVRQTDAILYPANPSTLGGDRNFVFDDPLPYVLTAPIHLGETLLQDTGGLIVPNTNRLYIQPGMMVKAGRGSGIEVLNPNASINVGDRTYIRGFDASPNYSPADLNFRPNTTSDARVLFTSFFDDTATTSFFDPVTGQTRIIVPAIDSDNGGPALQPTPGNVDRLARWGGVSILEGARATIDEAIFRFGGGPLNIPEGTDPIRPVLTFLPGFGFGFGSTGQGFGTRASVTNNDFLDNFEAAIAIAPDGLLAADPLTPLQSGNPFFRGNVMQRNTYNGLRVLSSPSVNRLVPFASGIGDGFSAGQNIVSQTVNAVWDDTDLTYILRGTIQLDGFNYFFDEPPLPDPNQFTAERRPFITLTIQSSLPDTLLANGQRVGRPGEQAQVKLLNFFVAPGDGVVGSTDDSAGGAGFLVGVDDGVDPDADRTIDAGAGSQIRFVGIGANESTGQQRVPVVITSLFDDTVGRTVRGVDMFDTFPNINPDPAFDPFAVTNGQARSAPAAGDGGLIYFGGNSLFDYNLFDPRGGNIIDNADIRFITRIELQGGGVIDVGSDDGDMGLSMTDSLREQKIGNQPLFQNNAHQAMTISNSNLRDFSTNGVLVHPGFNMIAGRDVGAGRPGFMPITTVLPARIGVRSQPVDLFMYNNSIANMPVGVRVNSETTAGPFVPGDTLQEPFWLVLLHNTFNNNPTALLTQAPLGMGGAAFNSFSSVRWLAMNNIFANSTIEAITTTGHLQGSQGQFNLFFNNTSNLSANENQGVILFPNGPFAGLNGSIIGDPQFRNAATGDFLLMPGSFGIDASRDVLGPINWGNILRPISDQVFNQTGGIRNALGRLGGLTDFFLPIQTNDIVGLPGNPTRDFVDQFVPALRGTQGSSLGSGSNPATYGYIPISGERDQLGFLRIDEASRPNVGAGGDPFFDVGAFEFRRLFPPVVTDVGAPDVDGDGVGDGVIATVLDPSAPGGVRPIDIYSVGGIAGTNLVPQNIQIQFDKGLDPETVNNLTVLLQASGGDGIFGNGNSVQDRFIDLSGKLVLDPTSRRRLAINLAASNLTLANDVYRIILLGSGSNVIRDPQGNALDGENLDAAGQLRPLPSGDGFPGGNFVVTFSIDTTPPDLVPGAFVLAAQSDTGARDGITTVNLPSFTGTITDIFPPTNPVLGQTVILDIDSNFDGIFERLNAGTAVTDAQGNFTVTVTGPPLPDSPADALGNRTFSVARVRIVDQSGNITIPTGPGTLAGFLIDTRGPRITGASPTPGGEGTIVNGRLQVGFAIDEGLLRSSLNNNSIIVTRSGGDGIFGNGNDVNIPIDANSIGVAFAPGAVPPFGPSFFAFTVSQNLGNDIYQVTLRGSGANAVTDVAGNAVDGEFNGQFPSGNGQPGGDFTFNFAVFNPALSDIIFVQAGATGTADGSRANPYPTIDGPNLPGPDGQVGTADDIIRSGLAAASTGDIVAVLPGTYIESIRLRSLVRLFSADPSSTDAGVVPGSAQQTLIRPPVAATGQTIAVRGDNLLSLPSVSTELRGFTIAAPLGGGNAASGPILPDSVGIELNSSDVLIDRNFVIDANVGISIRTAGGQANPRLESNGLIGNVNGLFVNDVNNPATSLRPVRAANNTFAFNTTGAVNLSRIGGPVTLDLVNNIFWQNHDRTAARNGTAIFAAAPGTTRVRSNLFSGNGTSQSSSADDTTGIGGGFDPSRLSPTPDGAGNFTGEPAFLAPRDPRPQFDGPAVFLTDANFGLASTSAAIDNALNAEAPAQDFRFRSRVDVPNRGFPGFGPADVGAFEFTTGITGSGTSATGGAFRVASASPADGAGLRAAGASSAPLSSAPDGIVVAFSGAVDRSTVQATDLFLSGDGLAAGNPARATSLSWVDDQTVRFNLSGSFASTGTVEVTLPDGSVRGRDQSSLIGFSDSFQLAGLPVATTPAPTQAPGFSFTPGAPPTAAPPAETPTAGPGRRAAARRQAAARRPVPQDVPATPRPTSFRNFLNSHRGRTPRR